MPFNASNTASLMLPTMRTTITRTSTMEPEQNPTKNPILHRGNQPRSSFMKLLTICGFPGYR